MEEEEGQREFRGFHVPATEACIIFQLVKIGDRLAICCYPQKIFQ